MCFVSHGCLLLNCQLRFQCTIRFAVSTRWEREVAENGPIRDFHRFWCCCARRLGNMFVLCERTDGTPIVITGPCWPFCIFVTLPLILAVSGAVAYFVIISDDSPLVSAIRRLTACPYDAECRCVHMNHVEAFVVRGFQLIFACYGKSPTLALTHIPIQRCIPLFLLSCLEADLGGVHLLSSVGIRLGVIVLRKLSRSRINGKSHG